MKLIMISAIGASFPAILFYFIFVVNIYFIIATRQWRDDRTSPRST